MRFGGNNAEFALPSPRKQVPARPKATRTGAFRPVAADLGLKYAVEVADEVLGIFEPDGQAEHPVTGEGAVIFKLSSL
jgi:hypothetical protein